MLSRKQIVIISLLIGFILASILIPLSLTGYFNSKSTSLKTPEDEDKREPVLEYIIGDNNANIASLIFDKDKNKWKQSNGMVFNVIDYFTSGILNDKDINDFEMDQSVKRKIKVNGLIHELESISQTTPLQITLSRSVVSLT